MIGLFLTKLFADKSVWALPVTAFALTSAIGFMVFGGGMYFYAVEDPELGAVYAVFATVALILLLVPMLGLTSSAARLMARRRDERLSSLRLLGATSGQLRRLVLAEATVLAAVGIILGAGLYAALMPAVGLLPFVGQRMGVSGLWLGFDLLALAAGVIFVIALGAAFIGMRRVQVTPLGVRTRRNAQTVWIGRGVIAVVAVVTISTIYNLVPDSMLPNQAFVFAIAFALLAIPLLAVQLLGPLVLRLITMLQAKRAKSPERLIAARNVLESPQQMWRQIGGVSVAAFVGVIAGCGFSLMSAGDQSMMDAESLMITEDVQRGVGLTLAVAFIMTACSVGLNQAAQILDRRDLYQGLVRTGFTERQLNQIRSLSVMRSLGAVLGVAVLGACVVAFPIVGAALVFQPLTLVVIAGVLLAGVAVVWLGTLSTRPTMRSVVLAA